MATDARQAFLNQLQQDGTLTDDLVEKLKALKKKDTIKGFPQAVEVEQLQSNKAKADYIFRRGKNMTPAQRNEYLAALEAAGVLTINPTY